MSPALALPPAGFAPGWDAASRRAGPSPLVSLQAVDIALLVTVTLAGLFATARITRLIAADKVTLPFRSWVVRRWGSGFWLSYLLHCRWCVSIYVAPVVAAAVLWLWDELSFDVGAVPWPQRIVLAALLALTFSHATALLAGLEDDD